MAGEWRCREWRCGDVEMWRVEMWRCGDVENFNSTSQLSSG
jgi:hypothetical protein